MQDLIINIAYIVFFVASALLFFRAVGVRVRLVRHGQPLAEPAPLPARLRSVLLNVLFQEKVFRYPLRGVMHLFIYLGFMIYLLHTFSQMVAALFWTPLKNSGPDPYRFRLTDYLRIHYGLTETTVFVIIVVLALVIGIAMLLYLHFREREMSGKRGKAVSLLPWPLGISSLLLVLTVICSGTHVYETVVLHLALLVLVGIVFFTLRRYVFRAAELDRPSAESAIVLILIAAIMLATLFTGAAEALLAEETHPMWINLMLGKVLTAAGIEEQASVLAARNLFWWLHSLDVAFLILLPHIKHSHLFFSLFSNFFISETPAGRMSFLNLEDENGIWGAGNVTELRQSTLWDSLACIKCGRCTLVCPANRTGKPLNPKEIMVQTKNAMLDHRQAILSHKEETPAPSPVVGEDYITDEELWSCTSCYACVDICPVGNNQLEAILDMRRYLVQVESRFPAQLQQAFVNMENQSNPWGIGSHSRADWCADLGVKTLAEDPQVEILYWVGCAGAFDERSKKTARSFVRLLRHADVKFGILGTEENCTGDSARRAGNEYLFQTLAAANIETLNRYGVKKIVTACPHCYNTLNTEYPQLGGNYEVIHHSVFIRQLQEEGRLPVVGGPSMGSSTGSSTGSSAEYSADRVVYHDSCYLSRYNQISDVVRELLHDAGRKPVEAIENHTRSLCCGAGGAGMWMEEKYERVNLLRTGQLLATGAETIAVACPFCMTMLSDGIKAVEKEESVRVMDIAEIAAQGLEEKAGRDPQAT